MREHTQQDADDDGIRMWKDDDGAVVMDDLNNENAWIVADNAVPLERCA